MEKMNNELESIIDKLECIANNDSLTEIYQAKNQDYGNSFEKTLDRFGLVASIIRLSDKMNRIKSLSQKKAKVESESIEDTLLDLANYAIMTVIWLRKNRINEE